MNLYGCGSLTSCTPCDALFRDDERFYWKRDRDCPQRRPRAAERSSQGHFGQTRVNFHRRAKLSPGLGLSGWSLLPPTRRGRTHPVCGLRKTAGARFDLDQNARNTYGNMRSRRPDYSASAGAVWPCLRRASPFRPRPGKYLSGNRRSRQSGDRTAERHANNEKRTSW